MEHAKKHEDPHATVCAELSNHEIFEKWRVIDTAALDGAKLEEFEADRAESNRRYDEAFRSVLAHTTKSELRAFWQPFGVALSEVSRMELTDGADGGGGGAWGTKNPMFRGTCNKEFSAPADGQRSLHTSDSTTGEDGEQDAPPQEAAAATTEADGGSKYFDVKTPMRLGGQRQLSGFQENASTKQQNVSI